MSPRTTQTNQTNNHRIKSWHTFIYPFSLPDFAMNDMVRPDKNCWGDEEFLVNEDPDTLAGDPERIRVRREQYGAYRYFLAKAQSNIFNVWMDSHKTDQEQEEQKKCCRIYRRTDLEDATYQIEYYNWEDQNTRQYTLDIHAIRLVIYGRMKIGLIQFEMENRRYDEIQDIKRINQLGRRLYMPYYDIDDQRGIICGQCATSIVIHPNSHSAPYRIRMEDTVLPRQTVHSNAPESWKLDTLQWLYCMIYGETAPRYKLHTVLDDRMFVCCAIRDNNLSGQIQRRACSIQGSFFGAEDYESSQTLFEQLYALLYIDDGDVTCKDRALLRSKLGESGYTRWVQYGTLLGVTEYSMLCVLDERKDDDARDDSYLAVVMPFITEYAALARLGLAQCAAIHRQEEKIERINRTVHRNRPLEQSQINDIDNAWKRYVIFQNNMYIPEATFQEQGRELYDMVKRSLRVEQLNWYLDAELRNLHALSSMEADAQEKASDKQLNDSINIVTVVGTALGFMALMQDALSVDDNKTGFYKWSVLFIYLVGILMIWFVHRSSGNIENRKDNKGSARWTKYLMAAFLFTCFAYAIVSIIAVVLW